QGNDPQTGRFLQSRSQHRSRYLLNINGFRILHRRLFRGNFHQIRPSRMAIEAAWQLFAVPIFSVAALR
ncbi:hypothetical protein NKJ95_30045, partial [Mesorhizobium sp. M0012]|uniref:hypothetical protein n=1 Tax=Mesorhizobium sp. M0012 TaxID=2956840 RepID=UPI0033381F7A